MKKTLLAVAFAALTLAAAGGGAVAQQASDQHRTPRPMRADADGDSRVSQAEFVGRRLQRLTAADANRDGSVAPEEMRATFQARAAQRADARFQRLDVDRDGSITRAEFDFSRAAVAAAARPHRVARPARMHRGQRMEARGPVSIIEARTKAEQAFTRLDADHDGFLTVAERQAGVRAGREQRRAARQARRQASPPASASE